jgi:F-type H+-transporting ATPase subunit c
VEALLPIAQAASSEVNLDAAKAIALGLGTGFGAIGPGVGVGYIFGKTIESVTRQPEMRGEIQSIMWLGFALTEAIVFYALMMSLVAFFIA